MTDAKKNYLTFYFLLTIVFSFLVCFISTPRGEHFGFWTRLLASVVSIPTGFLGALIGDAVRRFAIPDAIFTNGGLFAIIKTKLFWMCVPQLVGMFIGIGIVGGMILR
jgi:hypothetical protein